MYQTLGPPFYAYIGTPLDVLLPLSCFMRISFSIIIKSLNNHPPVDTLDVVTVAWSVFNQYFLVKQMKIILRVEYTVCTSREIYFFYILKMNHVSLSFLKIHIPEETSLVTYFKDYLVMFYIHFRQEFLNLKKKLFGSHLIRIMIQGFYFYSKKNFQNGWNICQCWLEGRDTNLRCIFKTKVTCICYNSKMKKGGGNKLTKFCENWRHL